CTVEGVSNGVGVTGGLVKDAAADVDVYHNTIQNINDDAIEVDLGNEVNLSIWGNYIANAIHGFSAVPSYIGPIYVLYNVFNTCHSGAIKEGGGNTATVSYVHNTISSGSQQMALDGVGGTYKGQIFRDNSMVGTSTYVVSDGWNNVPPLMDTATSSFDFDLE